MKTRVLLVTLLAIVITALTGVSLYTVRNHLRRQMIGLVSQDLRHSVQTFGNLHSERLAGLEREGALLANLPTLKALMTTSDPRTIADGSELFWKLSGADLFALVDNEGGVEASFTKVPNNQKAAQDALTAATASKQRTQYLRAGNTLYAYSQRPLYFGEEENGTLLGSVVNGFAIDSKFVAQVGQVSDAEAVFLANGTVFASTAREANPAEIVAAAARLTPGQSQQIELGGVAYLAQAEVLSDDGVTLVVLKSLQPLEAQIRAIDRTLTMVGLVANAVGCLLMIIISYQITRPLETLTHSMRAFGRGDATVPPTQGGTEEVRELGQVFGAMRHQIQQANTALLESERLATIGRMASSVSHDLRHYLASVYANAEFLSSTKLAPEERAELFEDIKLAVDGTTELIESLLTFSRTGESVVRAPVSLASVADRAAAILRKHPDAEHVELTVNHDPALNTVAELDAKQIERAIYNLLLNACQACATVENKRVSLGITTMGDQLCVTVTDSGEGVPQSVRESLFQPFVSEGKQKGTGLGLTLADCVAREHGGYVRLLHSKPGETVFVLCVERDSGSDSASHDSRTAEAAL